MGKGEGIGIGTGVENFFFILFVIDYINFYYWKKRYSKKISKSSETIGSKTRPPYGIDYINVYYWNEKNKTRVWEGFQKPSIPRDGRKVEIAFLKL